MDSAGTKGDVLEVDAVVELLDPSSDSTGWKVRLRTRRGATTGEREIEATTCEGVADATAVVLALALVTPGDDETAPPGPRPPTAAKPRDAPAPRKRTEDEARTIALGASAAGHVAALPSPSIGGSLTAAWTPGRVRVELDARRWASQSHTTAASNAGARFIMTSLGARGCWAALQAGRFDLSPCVGADVHLVSAHGYGADANYVADATWTSTTGGGLARLTLTSWLALRARAEAVVPLTRPMFIVANDSTLHRPPIFDAAASFGIEAHFL
jgi:hypothetical protein